MEKKEALALLEPFVGVWNTSGVLSDGKGTDIEITGTDTYKWLPGSFFMLHTVDVMMGSEHNESIEIIGYDEQKQMFTMKAFDNKGVETEMTANRNKESWIFSNDQLRFEGGFNTDDTVLSGNWKQKDDQGNWQLFIQINLEKIKSPAKGKI